MYLVSLISRQIRRQFGGKIDLRRLYTRLLTLPEYNMHGYNFCINQFFLVCVYILYNLSKCIAYNVYWKLRV